MADTRSRLQRAIHYALAEIRRVGGPENLPPAVRVVVIVHAAQGLIDNGGLQYFFESDFPGTPPYAIFVEAYRAIGADVPATNLEQAVALFPFTDPHKLVGRRNRFLDSFKDEEGDAVNSPFEPFTRQLCGNKEVWRLLEEFVSVHEAAFPPWNEDSR